MVLADCVVATAIVAPTLVVAERVVAVLGGGTVGDGVGAGGSDTAGGTKTTSSRRVLTPVPVTMFFVARLSTSVLAALGDRFTSVESAFTMAPATMGAAMLVPLFVPTWLFGSVELTSLPGA